MSIVTCSAKQNLEDPKRRMLALALLANGSCRTSLVVTAKELMDILMLGVKEEAPFDFSAKVRDAIVACIEPKAVDDKDLSVQDRIGLIVNHPYLHGNFN